MKDGIKHIWFDIEGTLTIRTPEFNTEHDNLRYQTYSEITNKPIDENLKTEFEELYKRHASNSAVFRSLGMPSDYWQQRFNTLEESKFYKPDERVYKTLESLKQAVPLSIFTNLTTEAVKSTLAIINVSPEWFIFTLSGDDIKERKPALDGFEKMIELSEVSPSEILYVGDREKVDILPAKELGMKTCMVWGHSDAASYSYDEFQGLLNLLD